MIPEARSSGGLMNEEWAFCGHSPFSKNPKYTAGFLIAVAGEEFDTAEA